LGTFCKALKSYENSTGSHTRPPIGRSAGCATSSRAWTQAFAWLNSASAAGSAGAGSGLAYRIVESGYRLNIPRMFAALLLLSAAGIVIFFALSLVSHLLLRRWHESAIVREV